MPQPQDMVKAITAFEARSKDCLFFREICATLTGISEKAFWEKIGLAFAQKKRNIESQLKIYINKRI